MPTAISSSPQTALQKYITADLTPDDDAAIYYSSGTTGLPKAILHTHKSLMCACLTEYHNHGQTKEDSFRCIPPLYHTGAKCTGSARCIGGKGVILRGVKPQMDTQAVSEEQITIVWLLVPWAQDILDAIDSGEINLDDYKLDQWRLMHIGAQPVPPRLSADGWRNSPTTSTTPTTAFRNRRAPGA